MIAGVGREPRCRRLDRRCRPSSSAAARRPCRRPGFEQIGLADEVRDEAAARAGRRACCGSPICSIRPLFITTISVRHGQRLLLVVRDEQEGLAGPLLDRLQLDLHLLAQLGVERAERLVEQQHLRVGRERPHQRHALALAAGELRRHALGVVLELHEREQLRRRAGGSASRVWPFSSRPKAMLRGDVHVREQRIVLEHDVHVAPVRRQRASRPCRRGRMRPEFGISKPPSMRSVVDLPQPEGPSRVTNLPASMREVEVVDGDVLAVALGDVFEMDDGLHQRVLARRVRCSA